MAPEEMGWRCLRKGCRALLFQRLMFNTEKVLSNIKQSSEISALFTYGQQTPVVLEVDVSSQVVIKLIVHC